MLARVSRRADFVVVLVQSQDPRLVLGWITAMILKL